MPAEGSARRTAQRRGAGQAAGQAAGEAASEAAQAREAEQVAVAAAELAVEAAGEAGSARSSGLPRQVVLMPSQELRSLVRSIVEGMQSAGYPGSDADGTSPVGTALTDDQQRLTLDYDVFRTALGRRGAAAIVLYRVADDKYIEITGGDVDNGSWIAVYGRPRGQSDRPSAEIGRARYSDGRAAIPGLETNPQIDRVEVLDRHGHPVRLGRPAGRPRISPRTRPF